MADPIRTNPRDRAAPLPVRPLAYRPPEDDRPADDSPSPFPASIRVLIWVFVAAVAAAGLVSLLLLFALSIR